MAKKKEAGGGAPLQLQADADDLKYFLEDAQDQLELLDQSLVTLEREGADAELVQTIFRAAHTLKGSSATIGHRKMAELTHTMETVLDEVRKGECEITTPLIDALLQALDALRVLTGEVASLTDSGIDCSAIVADLQAALSHGTSGGEHAQTSSGAAAAEHLHALASNARKGYAPYEVRVTLDSTCEMPAVRQFQLLMELSNAAHVVASWPTEPEIETGRVGLDFRALISTDKPDDDIRTLCGRVPDVIEVSVAPAAVDGGVEEAPVPAIELSDEQRELVQANAYKGLDARAIELRIEADCQMPAVRLFQALGELGRLGQVVHSNPSADEIEQGQTGHTLLAVLSAEESDEQIREALLHVPDLADVRVTPYSGAGAGASTEVDDERITAPPAPVAPDRRIIDVGPEGRGKTQGDLLRLASQKLNSVSKSVRIDVERLDALMNLVGELVIDRTRLTQLASRFSGGGSDSELLENLSETVQRLGRIADELQDQIMKSRMLPIENVFNRFPRMVRDLAQQAGKEVEFIIEGKETELDRSVIEEIGDPLIHLLRNAIDHGIEPPDERAKVGKPRAGRVFLSASHEENYIVIRVSDDGRGIDPDAIRASAVNKGVISAEAAERLSPTDARYLIFAPGFSTAAQVTDVSGRGVGMDIVKTNIERLNGSVEIASETGKRTEFIVKLPLTLAIIQALLVKLADETFAVPIAAVTETLRLDPNAVTWALGNQCIQLRGTILPLLSLREAFAAPPAETDEAGYVVAVRMGDRHVGFVVDELVGEQEIVIKSLGKVLSDVSGVAGATILGDGHVALIADVQSLVRTHSIESVAA